MGSTVHSCAIRRVLVNGKPAGKEYSYLPYGLNIKTEVTAGLAGHRAILRVSLEMGLEENAQNSCECRPVRPPAGAANPSSIGLPGSADAHVGTVAELRLDDSPDNSHP